MQIVPFLPHYQLVYINFDFSSFSLISYKPKLLILLRNVSHFTLQNNAYWSIISGILKAYSSHTDSFSTPHNKKGESLLRLPPMQIYKKLQANANRIWIKLTINKSLSSASSKGRGEEIAGILPANKAVFAWRCCVSSCAKPCFLPLRPQFSRQSPAEY